MLHQLPVEVALHAVAYLPLQSIYNIILVSRAWHDLVVTNESEVYRNAALLHRFVGADKLHARYKAKGPNAKAFKWKPFCVRQLHVERGWRAKAPSIVNELTATGNSVHRIKVDDQYGFVITTCRTGGLRVTDIKDNRELWALPQSHVVRYAHCEYARGYIIFNRYDNHKEVWRHVLDIHDDKRPANFPPDEKMRNADAEASSKFRPTGRRGSRRGQFRPWSLLQTPDFTQFFRFSYPTLLASATNNAYVYDIPNSRLVKTIRDIQQMRDDTMLGRVSYVEVNDQYAFICGSKELRIFARESGALEFCLRIDQLSRRSWNILACNDRGMKVSTILKPLKLKLAFHAPGIRQGTFVALHVSPSGKNIAALTSTGFLVLIPGFERLFLGEVALDDIAIQIDFGTPNGRASEISKYLAMGEQSDKIAVATTYGIYAIIPELQFSRLTAERPPYPGISVYQLHGFDDPQRLSVLSCLQVTHSGIYYNSMPQELSGSQQLNHFGGMEALNLLQTIFENQQNAAGLAELNGDDTSSLAVEEEDGFDSEDDDLQMNEENIDAIPMLMNWFLQGNRSTVYSVTF